MALKPLRQRPCVRSGLGDIGDLTAGRSKHEELTDSITTAVADISDIDRTAELLIYIWASLFGKKDKAAEDDAAAEATPQAATPYEGPTEVATFAAGCFWCTEAIFRALRGVVHVVPGYAGGSVTSPTYEQVLQGSTGHAECVQVVYDPLIISYEQLLEVFFATHDPTTPNRQGNDVGRHYRSAVLWSNEEQRQQAEQMMERVAAERWYGGAAPVTELRPLEGALWSPAEARHRDYYAAHPEADYCLFVVSPKLRTLRQRFTYLLQGAPQLQAA